MTTTTIQIELDTEAYQGLEQLARDNGTDPATLLREQIERLVAAYQGQGLTPGVQNFLNETMEKHRGLLLRLAK